ncbi:hypothetical protein [Spirosoma endbachense]|uniref:DUF932 domain-containing protein n=1 Tax=Spirosoma endbachense TaxID=2666025 RepID=A0A6P1VZ40_9BACT|nr:hypothetical protein [Spirosoma endbachense]QHV96676.1 hypothetical protein GJR95_17395 [Spirosoma endbachense]
MTYISAQPELSTSWEDICFPVEPLLLSDLLPDYDIIATDRQKLIVGQLAGGRKTLFGIQSADYTIIPNRAIQEVVDELIPDYQLLIKHTNTGEFSISIILPTSVSVGKEELQRSLTITNSYNGKTPFGIQGQSLTALLDPLTHLGSSVYRNVCQNGLLGWADSFTDLPAYQTWLGHWAKGPQKVPATKTPAAPARPQRFTTDIRKLHQSAITIPRFQQQLHTLLLEHLTTGTTLTATVYDHFQLTNMAGNHENVLRHLPLPVQLIKQARERLRLEERLLNSPPSCWLLYNAVNYALFTARSSLTLNDRYRLDERVFHHLAAQAYA